MFLYSFFRILISIFESVSKGISSHLMKSSSKRRRTKQEIKDQKAEEIRREQEIQDKMSKYDELQLRMQQMEESMSEQQQNMEMVNRMWEQGILKQGSDGNV